MQLFVFTNYCLLLTPQSIHIGISFEISYLILPLHPTPLHSVNDNISSDNFNGNRSMIMIYQTELASLRTCGAVRHTHQLFYYSITTRHDVRGVCLHCFTWHAGTTDYTLNSCYNINKRPGINCSAAHSGRESGRASSRRASDQPARNGTAEQR